MSSINEAIKALETQLRWRGFIANSQSIQSSADKALAFEDFEAPYLAFPVFMGEPFYVSSEICTVLEVAARTFPMESTTTPEITDLPSTVGLAILAKPISLPRSSVVDRNSREINGIGWVAGYDSKDAVVFKEDPRIGVGAKPPVALQWTVYQEQKEALIFRTSMQMAPKEKFSKILLAGRKLLYEKAGYSIEDLEIFADRQRIGLGFSLALWAFISQGILSTRRVGLPRPLRRRFPEYEQGIQLVTLRRYKEKEALNSKEEKEEIEWACQWIVRGHWRKQFYPSSGLHKPIWILPFVKGPEDKPLRERPRIFDVTR